MPFDDNNDFQYSIDSDVSANFGENICNIVKEDRWLWYPSQSSIWGVQGSENSADINSVEVHGLLKSARMRSDGTIANITFIRRITGEDTTNGFIFCDRKKDGIGQLVSWPDATIGKNSPEHICAFYTLDGNGIIILWMPGNRIVNYVHYRIWDISLGHVTPVRRLDLPAVDTDFEWKYFGSTEGAAVLNIKSRFGSGVPGNYIRCYYFFMHTPTSDLRVHYFMGRNDNKRNVSNIAAPYYIKFRDDNPHGADISTSIGFWDASDLNSQFIYRIYVGSDGNSHIEHRGALNQPIPCGRAIMYKGSWALPQIAHKDGNVIRIDGNQYTAPELTGFREVLASSNDWWAVLRKIDGSNIPRITIWNKRTNQIIDHIPTGLREGDIWTIYAECLDFVILGNNAPVTLRQMILVFRDGSCKVISRNNNDHLLYGATFMYPRFSALWDSYPKRNVGGNIIAQPIEAPANGSTSTGMTAQNGFWGQGVVLSEVIITGEFNDPFSDEDFVEGGVITKDGWDKGSPKLRALIGSAWNDPNGSPAGTDEHRIMLPLGFAFINIRYLPHSPAYSHTLFVVKYLKPLLEYPPQTAEQFR
jgi:hypothetical protein